LASGPEAQGPRSARNPLSKTQRIEPAAGPPAGAGPASTRLPYDAYGPGPPGPSPSVHETLVSTSGFPVVRPPMGSSPAVASTRAPASTPSPYAPHAGAPPGPSVTGTRPPVAAGPSVGSTLVSGPASTPSPYVPRPPTALGPSVLGTRPPTLLGPSVLGTRPPVATTLASGGAPSIRYPAPGDVITSMRGVYHVRALVGQGRYGTVYEALGPFDQRYALKLLVPANRHYAEVQGEWRREAERLLLLRHPGVIYLHDAFEANYLFYMAFEWCHGSLSDLLVEPLGPELAIELARQILAATQYLHDNDVVHDDLHSGNVLFTRTDRPIIKIADFGISKELRGRAKARPEVVHHAIMAPEVVSAGYTSRQSDIYQVGLLLFWMVAGKPPLDYNVPYNDLVRQVSDGLPRQRAEQLGTPLGAVIAKMLRRRDAYRYASAREVWEELREVPEWRNRQLFRDPL
jgi:serine/threonine-protein kinase